MLRNRVQPWPMPSEAQMRCGLHSTHTLKLTSERPAPQSQRKMRLY